MCIDSVAERLGGVCPAGHGEFFPMTDAELTAIERQVGADLPPSYRSLLQRFGAFAFKGRSSDNPFIYFRAKNDLPTYLTTNGLSIIRFFYGATRKTGPTGLQNQINFFRGRIPDSMIPIAGDGGAGQICLGIRGDDVEKVFYWDMANEPLDEETYLEDFGEQMPPEIKRQNVYLVADSFQEFIGQLVLWPEA